MSAKALHIIADLIRREADFHRVRPTHCLFFLTYRCTSRCGTCRMWQRTAEDTELSLAEWKRLVDMLVPRGIRNVEMFGGDALLRPDVLFALTRYCKEKLGCSVDLVTNGNLLDRATAEEIVRAGIDVVYVSLDGVGALHDAVRGVAGSFDKADQAIRNLLAARPGAPGAGTGHAGRQPKIVVNCTVSAFNIDGFEQVLEYAAGTGVDQVAFEYAGEFPVSSVEASIVEGIKAEPFYLAGERSVLLDAQQARLLKEKIRRIRAWRNNGLKVVTRNIDCLTEEQLTGGIMPHRRCYICRYLITVDPYGAILPCAFFSGYSLGNFKEEHFLTLWNNRRHRRFRRQVDSGAVALCRHCIVGVERNPSLWQSLKRKAAGLV